MIPSWARLAGLGSVAALLLVAGLPAVIQAQDASAGQSVFQAKCAACHSAGPDRLVGPGLQDVAERRDHDWLVEFIVAPDRLIAGGDPIAEQLLQEYGMPMPNLGVTRQQANDILAYLAGRGKGSAGTETAGAGSAAAAGGPAAGAPSDAANGAGDPEVGRRLFTGERRLANGGAACISCHTVSGIGGLGGGTLAKELTGSAALYGAGLPAVLETPPFPLMQAVYAGRPLTADEVADLSAYLEEAAGSGATQASRSVALPAFGLGGMVLLLVLAALTWRGRLRGVRKPLIATRTARP